VTLTEGAKPAYSIYRGTDLETTLFRVTETCPPGQSDFLSYVLAGRAFPPEGFFRALGVSLWLTEAKARKMARSGQLGRCYAEVDLRGRAEAYLSITNHKTGHVTVWAPPRLLLECVVRCVDTEQGA